MLGVTVWRQIRATGPCEPGAERGLALFPRFFVERELASGKLVQAIRDYPPPELSINAVYETRRHLLPKLQVFLGLLKERIGAEP